MAVKKRLLMTGAAGYVANQMLHRFRDKYELVLLDTSTRNRNGEEIEGVNVVDLIDKDRSVYSHFFDGVDAVIHLAYKRRSGQPLDHFFDENQNVQMAYNVLRSSYDSGVDRVVIASSNHAADFYEHALIHGRMLEMLDPYKLALSDNFYGWAKASYEHLGFLFACGGMGEGGDGASGNLVDGNLNTSRKMG
ncbi:MAG TPA: NAD(P)-dependent oxidoreductase, partial [Dehalococcoidia bacterium]|nr:NAD(P)-dependent oxidoreductase [Dehalococcoidia bacterium]